MMANISPYQKRHIRFTRLVHVGDWTVKIYWISPDSETPDPDLISAGLDLAGSTLPNSAFDEGRHGAAVVIVHEARDGCYVLLDWWVCENMLQHRVFHSVSGNPAEFVDFGVTGVIACVWELYVLAFEREAWVEHVLSRKSGPGEYFRQQLAVDI